jgi:flagellum-specific peptidoglycan hydrolase FlgJ
MTPAEKDSWFAKYYPLALATEKKYGVPALVTLAQHVWEGGWNNQNKYFNLFGVKADSTWKGAKQLQDTWEVHPDKTHKYPKVYSITLRQDGKYLYKIADWFRAYPSLQAAYDDHAAFLVKNPRYKPAFAHKDPEGFAKAMAAAGYATDPDYYKKLSSLFPEFKKKAASFTLPSTSAALPSQPAPSGSAPAA